MAYTAKEVANLLQKEGYPDITTRMVNYYAFEKKMFDVSLTGKSCFTDKEVEKIKAIKKLQKTTSFTLEQIKEIINSYEFDDIMNRVSPIVYQKVEDFYQSPGYTESLLTSYSGNLAATNFSPGSLPFSSSIESNNMRGYSVSSVNNQPRTIQVNPDVTLTVSSQVDTQMLAEMVTSIQEITQNLHQKERKE